MDERSKPRGSLHTHTGKSFLARPSRARASNFGFDSLYAAAVAALSHPRVLVLEKPRLINLHEDNRTPETGDNNRRHEVELLPHRRHSSNKNNIHVEVDTHHQ